MNQEELRKHCKRFFWCHSIADAQDLLTIYCEFLFNAVFNHHEENVSSRADQDARLIIQMMLTKALHLRNVLSGITFTTKKGKKLNRIVDPTIVASLIRNIYETSAMFNLIYRNTTSIEEKKILYLLWAHAGLSFRQRFENVITSEENRKTAEQEKIVMQKMVLDIQETDLYKQLDSKDQQKIKQKINDRDYLITFEEGKVKFLSWRELVDVMKIKNGKLNHAYGYFSLYSHPSNVSVFQFAEMFKKGEESYPNIVIFNLQISFFMFSIFIADYINLFPKVIKTFEELDIVDQIVINFHNNLARGHEFSINDKWKLLG